MAHKVQQHFNIDELYRQLVQWMVADNQPFTVIDNPFFQSLLAFLHPHLQQSLVGRKQIKEKIMNEAHVGCTEMQSYLKVCRIH